MHRNLFIHVGTGGRGGAAGRGGRCIYYLYIYIYIYIYIIDRKIEL